jgi:hypothetical protein
MAQQGTQMRFGAREGFAFNSVKLVLLANGNSYEVDSNTFFFFLFKFQSPLSTQNIALPQTLTFLTHIRICSRCAKPLC